MAGKKRPGEGTGLEKADTLHVLANRFIVAHAQASRRVNFGYHLTVFHPNSCLQRERRRPEHGTGSLSVLVGLCHPAIATLVLNCGPVLNVRARVRTNRVPNDRVHSEERAAKDFKVGREYAAI